MRSFVALPLSENLIAAYRNLYEEGRRRYPRLRWVRPENLHVTIRFLGETSPDAVEPLRREVEAEVGREASFPLTIGPPGEFSGRGRGRVLWFGLADGVGRMEELARCVESAVRRCGFARERRPWRPHLTVARQRARSPDSPSECAWESLGRDSGLAGLTMKVENVALLESTLRAEGPLHSLLWEAPLAAPESSASHAEETDDKKPEVGS